LLRASFATEVGIVGGGSHELRPLTVTTYDSAYLHMEHFGARFGLVVFDECHHLPGGTYQLAAELCLAPFRLGLTATPERPDGKDSTLDRLIGPILYRRDIVELAGEYLSEYETVRLDVELGADERAEYEAERKLYLDFLRASGFV
jgi:superfamily II DNA or RNA helicase